MQKATPVAPAIFQELRGALTLARRRERGVLAERETGTGGKGPSGARAAQSAIVAIKSRQAGRLKARLSHHGYRVTWAETASHLPFCRAQQSV